LGSSPGRPEEFSTRPARRLEKDSNDVLAEEYVRCGQEEMFDQA
jgi:hypothetical protein